MTELELKLVWLGDAPDLTGVLGPLSRTLQLHNQYFDTVDGALAARLCGLRLRRCGDDIEQTLKGPAPDRDGVRVRREWNWPRDAFSIDRAVLPVQAQVEGALIATSSNRVVRRVWDLPGIEVVMDQGEVRVGERVSPIAEIEIEDKGAGWPAVLEQARRIASAVPCFIGAISKAERGRVLAGGNFASNGAPLDALGRALDPLSGPDWSGALSAAEMISPDVAARVRRQDADTGLLCLGAL
ncbi:CYTH domain-containing protein [Litorivicinus lipolyticus]|uniref:CYTH domain-containing protein n=1 Tax=Litorivicinus lipolyticus TaxID=418701 RepID=A0A5Q2Q585_9GAMM|nr:CYTH domain-containing protein [Litorivicinus lipolyticus]QGG79099.1 CYTH domain-containing protein [Litorivicinus lipolyticus]